MIEDPQFGRIEGEKRLRTFSREYRIWLGTAASETVAVSDTDRRIVAEFVLNLARRGGNIPLPVAVAADKAQGAFSTIRVYHSTWPLEGNHRLRPPLLPEDPTLKMPDVVGRYHEALTRGDLEKILAAFEDDGYAREPAGGEYLYRGKKQLREFYGRLFSNGGILLEHCSLTDDGIRAALEYNAIKWGETDLPPQAGIAVYERGASGLLKAARIYDDVEPPV